ncbi:unnamed protein product [Moneuplotes crassus]|uniref:Proteinase inhibitor I42 chagasin domain-containing protein n=1 Tax=Euplotes crassus TaxID=5936 RepID=A0AAD1Y3H1_EUPCR|nr:unnamed protein product [Moneuplotes crassus]
MTPTKIFTSFVLILCYISFVASKEIIVDTRKEGNSKNISTEVGDTITFIVDSNPTTGFTWNIAQILMNQNHIYNVIENQFVPDPVPEEDEEMDGRGGIEKITVSIDRPGKDLLQLIHARPWMLYKIDKMDEEGYWDVEPAKAKSIDFKITAEANGDL